MPSDSNNQSKLFYLFTVLRSGAHKVYSCRINTAVPENVGKLCNVFFGSVKKPCEKMTEIMRKHFFTAYICIGAKSFKLSPNITAAHRLSRFCDKHTAFFYACLAAVRKKLFSQLPHKKDRSGFIFARNGRLGAFHRLNGDVFQLAYADSGRAKSLHYQTQPIIILSFGGFAKTKIFIF